MFSLFLCITSSIKDVDFERNAGRSFGGLTSSTSSGPRKRTFGVDVSDLIKIRENAIYMGNPSTNNSEVTQKTYSSASDPQLLTDLTALIGAESANKFVKKIKFAKSTGTDHVNLSSNFEGPKRIFTPPYVTGESKNLKRVDTIINLVKNSNNQITLKSSVVTTKAELFSFTQSRTDGDTYVLFHSHTPLLMKADELTYAHSLINEKANDLIKAAVSAVKN